LSTSAYEWRPEVIAKAKMTCTFGARQILDFKGTSAQAQEFAATKIVRDGLGITDASAKELAPLTTIKYERKLAQALADMISPRALLGWSTHGHSGVDVPLFAYGRQASELRGNHQHTDLAKFMAKFMGVSLDRVTAKLNAASKPRKA